ncbi:hypothetical protein GCM10009682_45390 [Luedemannella flava]|uniref:Uncharacterized protein n=1 Tax=Luedemannella flava TaxID=349316 RepID=A0ABP4YJB1_9ACTN
MWIGFTVLAAYAPLAARVTDDASWLFSVAIASLLAVVLIADDAESRRVTRKVPPPSDL